MKKKNLLTLGALCLSLGLVVSSCNQAGTEGPTGPTGPTGPQGEPGVPGTDGKTYKDVIVIHDDKLDGGDIKQSVYFVTEGAHDEVTFTFTPDDATNNVVIDFEINGEVVTDLDPVAGSYTIDGDDYEGTIQVTGATFTSVDKYGQKLLDDTVKEILKTDKSLDLVNSEEVTFLDHSKNEFIENEYSADATSALQKVYNDATDAVAKAVTDAKKEHKDDVKAQLEAIETVANGEITKINDAYKKAVDDAKVVAKEDLADLSDELTREEFAEEDQKAQLESFEGKIDAATTIQGLGQIISGSTPEGTYETGDAEANSFYNLKKIAFGEIDTALASVEDFGDELDAETPEGKQLLASLKTWGVDTSKLPSAIAEEQYKIISAATEIKWVEDKTNGDHTDLGYAGAEAVKGAVTDIKDTLIANIKEKYHKEINESKALEGQDQTKTALLGVVDTAISNFVYADTNQTTMSLSQYVGTKFNTSWINPNVGSTGDNSIKEAKSVELIGYIEYMLAQPVNGSVNSAFANERIQTAKTEVLKELEAAKDKITDSAYLALTSYTKKGNDKYIASDVLTEKGDVSSKTKNPFFTVTGDAKTGFKVTNEAKPSLSLVQVNVKDSTGTTKPVTPTYNLNDWYTALTKDEVEKPTSGDNQYGTLYLQEWANKHLNDFQEIYQAGLKLIKNVLGGVKENGYLSSIPNLTVYDKFANVGVYGTIAASGLPGTYKNTSSSTEADYESVPNDKDFVTGKSLSDEWEKLNASLSLTTPEDKISNVSDLITFADGIKENTEALNELNSGFKTWFYGTKAEGETTYKGGIVDSDNGFEAWYNTHDSEVYTAFDNELKAVLSGSETLSSVKSWTRPNNLNRIYESDVESYLAEAKASIEQVYNVTKAQLVGNAEKLKDLNTVYSEFTSFIGHKLRWDATLNKYVVDDSKGDVTLYLCDSIESVFNWVTDANKSLTNKVDETLTPQVIISVPDFDKLPGSAQTPDDPTTVNGQNMENPSDFKLTKENGIYVASGSVNKFASKEQASGWSPDADTTTTFAIVQFTLGSSTDTNLTRVTGWVNDPDTDLETSGVDVKTKAVQTPGSSIDIVLGLTGAGVTNQGNPYFKAVIKDSSNKVVATYVFDFSAFIK